jgi:hypothetical protein
MGEEAGRERERERQRCDVILCSFIQEVLDRDTPRNKRGLIRKQMELLLHMFLRRTLL